MGTCNEERAARKDCPVRVGCFSGWNAKGEGNLAFLSKEWNPPAKTASPFAKGDRGGFGKFQAKDKQHAVETVIEQRAQKKLEEHESGEKMKEESP